jgi:outer membrane protein assembly factor BamB
MKSIILFILAVCFAFFETHAQIAQFGGPHRNGIYDETGLLDKWPEDGPELITTISGIGKGYGSPAINENGVYIAGMIDSTGYVFHFNHKYELQWKTKIGKEFSFKYEGSRGTPTVEDNRLYYVASFGDAVCLDVNTGEYIWHVNIQDKFNGPEIKWGYTESPLIYKDKIYFTPGGNGNNFVALNKLDGSLIWSVDLDSTVNSFCSPVIVNHQQKDLILLNTSNYILMIDPLEGGLVVKHPLTNDRKNHALPPLYMVGKLFYSSGYGEGTTMFKIKENSLLLDTIYSNSDFDCKLSGLIPYQGIVFGTSDKRKQWTGVDLETGKTVFTTREIKPGSLILANNKFFIFTDTGEVVLAKPSNKGFEVISRFDVPAKNLIYAFAHPVIYNGTLFIRYNNNLWCYRVK